MITARLLIILAFIGCSFVGANAGTLRTFSVTDVVRKASGVGSQPAVILRDGTVCAIEANDHSQCTSLGTLPASDAKIIGDSRTANFDGVFNLLGDGVPQVFVDYWPQYNAPDCLAPYNQTPYRPGEKTGCDAIALLVYRYSGGGYQRYLTLSAPTEGYAPGAWFLDESPRKAVFQTRCGGSSGECLFYLDLHKHSLEPISDYYFLEGEPVFEDLDHDGNAEIFIPARGRDRTAAQGAAILRWTGTTYRVWWPDWERPPYVIYAQIAQVGGDGFKEIVAVLDTRNDSIWGPSARELAVWKLAAGKWCLVAKTTLSPSDETGFPQLAGVIREPRGARILLTNGDEGGTLTCRYPGRKITCPPSPRAAK
ncbi:hypothetical protein [Candidatus Binatus sp.]|uniref:hypothetical protein n=1 Tax=Candidatus Binatus sp. TaxID=2811406 RepID=UPI002F95B51F